MTILQLCGVPPDPDKDPGGERFTSVLKNTQDRQSHNVAVVRKLATLLGRKFNVHIDPSWKLHPEGPDTSTKSNFIRITLPGLDRIFDLYYTVRKADRSPIRELRRGTIPFRFREKGLLTQLTLHLHGRNGEPPLGDLFGVFWTRDDSRIWGVTIVDLAALRELDDFLGPEGPEIEDSPFGPAKAPALVRDLRVGHPATGLDVADVDAHILAQDHGYRLSRPLVFASTHVPWTRLTDRRQTVGS